MRETRFWPKMKFKMIFFQVLWQFFNPKGSLPQAGGRGGGGGFRPPYKFWANWIRIFWTPHRQWVNFFVGPPPVRARQPILSTNWNFLSLPRYCGAGQKRASIIFNWTVFILFVIIFMKG